MKLSKGKIQKLHNTKNQSQRKNKKKGKKRPANHNTLRKRHINLATKTLKRKNKSILYGGNDDTGKVGQKFEELIDAMSEVFASKVASKIGSTGQGSSSGDNNQDPIETNRIAAKKTGKEGDTLLDEAANSITPKTPNTPTVSNSEESVTPQDTSTVETPVPQATTTTDTPTDTPTVPPPPKKSRFSSFLNSTRKSWADGKEKRQQRRKDFADRLVAAKQAASKAASEAVSQARDSFDKTTQSNDEKKSNKICDDNDKDKSGKLNETEYKDIQTQFEKDGFLTLPAYDKIPEGEKDEDGVNKKQFVQLYKTAITEAKAKLIFDENDTDKSLKIKQEKYKDIKDKLVKEKGLTLPDYDKIPEGEKDADGINKEQFAKLYKDAAANSNMLSRMSSRASSKGSNLTRKMRNSFDKTTQSIDEKKANKLFDDNDKNKRGKLNKSEYEGIQKLFEKDGFLTLPDYSNETYPDGINKKQFVQLYKTAITEAKAKAKAEATQLALKKKTPIKELTGEKAAKKIFKTETEQAKIDKINEEIYKKIKEYLSNDKLNLTLPDYNKLKEKKDEDGVNENQFVNIYKEAKAKANLNKTKQEAIREELYKILKHLNLVRDTDQYKKLNLDPGRYKKIKHSLRDNTNLTIQQLTKIRDENKGLKLQDYKKIPKEEKDKDGKINKNLLEKLYVDAKDAKAKEKAKGGGAKKNRTRKLKGNKKGNKKGKWKRTK